MGCPERVDDGLFQVSDEVVQPTQAVPGGLEGGGIDQTDGDADLVIGQLGRRVHVDVGEDLLRLHEKNMIKNNERLVH